ncbi:MAG: ribonuclease HI family protein [Anaerosomatales bacterium]|nr:ribonuclease HI family protein [Anaerosomatales bacterium]
MMRTGILHADGAARGNPGPAAIGVVVTDSDGAELKAFGEAIGVATNNVAEYRALIAGLQAARDLGIDSLRVRLDSELLVRQMTGAYRVKSAHLKPLHELARTLASTFADVRFEHVPRSENARADALCNQALDAPEREAAPDPHAPDEAAPHPRLF